MSNERNIKIPIRTCTYIEVPIQLACVCVLGCSMTRFLLKRYQANKSESTIFMVSNSIIQHKLETKLHVHGGHDDDDDDDDDYNKAECEKMNEQRKKIHVYRKILNFMKFGKCANSHSLSNLMRPYMYII